MKTPIPYWKVKREFERLYQQIWRVFGFFYEPFISKYHDIFFNDRVKITEGLANKKNKIAIILIYQPNGIASSIFNTCQHLIKNGFSPFIISNLVITQEDITVLKGVAWRVLERPNYGYDFGGYRDGIRLLKEWAIDLEYLLILNDSIWFPLSDSDDLLNQMIQKKTDLTGTLNLVKDRNEFSDSIGFLGSYFYLISKNLYESKYFSNFWKNYINTNNKYSVLKQGENLFTLQMMSAGFSISFFNSYYKFSQKIKKQPNQFLFKTLIYGAYIDPDWQLESTQLIESYSASSEWRELAIHHILKVSRKRHFHASFSYAHLYLSDAKYIKKNNTDLFLKSRQMQLMAVAAVDLPPPIDEIAKELRRSI